MNENQCTHLNINNLLHSQNKKTIKENIKKPPKSMQFMPAYLKYSHEVDSCCTFFDVDLLSLFSFDFNVLQLDLLELLSLKLNNLRHNFGVEVIGLPLASGNKPIIIKYLLKHKT